MDPLRNPFAPGAGSQPPELAGRDALIARAGIALDRLEAGRPARGFMLYGLRGTGKTVLLAKLRADAEARRQVAVWIEAPEDRSLPALLAPPLRSALLRLDRMAAAGAGVRRALAALAGFVKLKVKYADIEVGVDFEPMRGLADSGDLAVDLAELFVAIGEAARDRGTVLVLFIDELQYVREPELAALAAALHAVARAGLPVGLFGAGLPPLVGQLGRAKSYTERLFEYAEVSALDEEAAWHAIVRPIEREAESIAPEAVHAIIRATRGYPYFLQEWGKHAWDLAVASPITLDDAEKAGARARAELDRSFFRVRFDRLTPSEKRYMRAMAELGPGPHRSADIAERLGRRIPQLAPIRAKLIAKGMIYSPAHGDTAFTVPMFDEFMRRTMPSL